MNTRITDGETVQVCRQIPQPNEVWRNSKNCNPYMILLLAENMDQVPHYAKSANNDIRGLIGPQIVYCTTVTPVETYHRNLDEFMGTRWDGTHYVFRFVKVVGV